MSQAAANVAPLAPVAGAQVPNGIAFITGRVERSTRRTGKDGTYFLTLIKMPAPDEFSSPSTVEVSSQQQVGARGDSVRVKVRVFGFPRSYSTKPNRDNPDGELVYTADNRLEVIA
jgi:hypothetical protein